jgi:6-pyruvoyltetrahydropterin/6-carboxytetrahydropterin synthase
MYECGVVRHFKAKHALAGDFGDESKPHFHDYRLEVSLRGFSLDEDGFLFNLAELEEKSDEVVKFLLSYPSINQVPGIKEKNPSVENLATCILENIAEKLDLNRLDSITVTLWESDSAWASYTSSAREQRERAGT